MVFLIIFGGKKRGLVLEGKEGGIINNKDFDVYIMYIGKFLVFWIGGLVEERFVS